MWASPLLRSLLDFPRFPFSQEVFREREFERNSSLFGSLNWKWERKGKRKSEKWQRMWGFSPWTSTSLLLVFSRWSLSLSLCVSVSVWMERKAGKRNESLNLNFLFVFVSICSWFVLVFFLSYSELFELSLVKWRWIFFLKKKVLAYLLIEIRYLTF